MWNSRLPHIFISSGPTCGGDFAVLLVEERCEVGDADAEAGVLDPLARLVLVTRV